VEAWFTTTGVSHETVVVVGFSVVTVIVVWPELDEWFPSPP